MARLGRGHIAVDLALIEGRADALARVLRGEAPRGPHGKAPTDARRPRRPVPELADGRLSLGNERPVVRRCPAVEGPAQTRARAIPGAPAVAGRD